MAALNAPQALSEASRTLIHQLQPSPQQYFEIESSILTLTRELRPSDIALLERQQSSRNIAPQIQGVWDRAQTLIENCIVRLWTQWFLLSPRKLDSESEDYVQRALIPYEAISLAVRYLGTAARWNLFEFSTPEVTDAIVSPDLYIYNVFHTRVQSFVDQSERMVERIGTLRRLQQRAQQNYQ